MARYIKEVNYWLAEIEQGYYTEEELLVILAELRKRKIEL